MYKIGDIVYFNHIIFSDGIKDNKKKRPCVVLCSYNEFERESILFCMPLTSKISSFNKNYDNYMFISNVIYDYKKLSFIKLDNLFIKNACDAHDTGMTLNEENIASLKSRIINYKTKKEIYKFLLKALEYNELLEQKEKKELKKQRKLERTLKRREAKNNNVKNI